MSYINNDNQREVIKAVLDMVKKQEINIQPQTTSSPKKNYEKESSNVTIYELTSLMLLGLYISGNAGAMSWIWILVPILIPYVVLLGVFSYNKIKSLIKK